MDTQTLAQEVDEIVNRALTSEDTTNLRGCIRQVEEIMETLGDTHEERELSRELGVYIFRMENVIRSIEATGCQYDNLTTATLRRRVEEHRLIEQLRFDRVQKNQHSATLFGEHAHAAKVLRRMEFELSRRENPDTN